MIVHAPLLLTRQTAGAALPESLWVWEALDDCDDIATARLPEEAQARR